MENILNSKFIELNECEMQEIDGGVATETVALVIAVAVGAFQAGRAYVRDLKNKFS